MMGMSIGHLGVACSGTLGLVYALKYDVWSKNSSVYLSLDLA